MFPSTVWGHHPGCKIKHHRSATNPVAREYPRNYINIGIGNRRTDHPDPRTEASDLSGNGLPHDKLAAPDRTAGFLGEDSDEDFAIVFAAMGVNMT